MPPDDNYDRYTLIDINLFSPKFWGCVGLAIAAAFLLHQWL